MTGQLALGARCAYTFGMRIILILLAIFTASSAFAGAESPIINALFVMNGMKSAPHQMGILRLSGGMLQTEMYDVRPTATVKEYKVAKGPWGEIDFGAILMMHFGFAQITDADTQVDYNGGGLRAGKISFDRYRYGLKFLLPIKYINPFIGGGIMSGHMTVRDTTVDGQKEHSRMYGAYWNAGIDILFSPVVGLRLAYTKDRLKTHKFKNLGNTAIELDEHIGQAGLLFYF